MKKTPSVSIIVPTCDRPFFLERALHSIEKQTFKDFEVIVVDDGKENRGMAVVEKFNVWMDLIYLSNDMPMGVSWSRNVGASKAKGFFLAFLDDDDWWDSLFLEKIYYELVKKNIDIIAAGFWNVYESSVEYGKMPPAELVFNDFIERNPGITGSNFLIKKSVFNISGRFDEKLPTSNDIDFVLKLIQINVKYAVLKERLVYKNQQLGNNRLTLLNKRKVLGSLRFYNKYKKMITNTKVKKRIKSKVLLRLFICNLTKKTNFKKYSFLVRSISLAPLMIIKMIIRRKFV